MATSIIPIYTSSGDAEAFLSFPFLYNRAGEWIGFVTPQREVYSVLGYYVGTLTNDPRIIRKRSSEYAQRLKPPRPPAPLRINATIPLAKLMSDLTPENIDVLQDEPELLHTLVAGEMRLDLD